jgi:hypothetical protein
VSSDTPAADAISFRVTVGLFILLWLVTPS